MYRMHSISWTMTDFWSQHHSFQGMCRSFICNDQLKSLGWLTGKSTSESLVLANNYKGFFWIVPSTINQLGYKITPPNKPDGFPMSLSCHRWHVVINQLALPQSRDVKGAYLWPKTEVIMASASISSLSFWQLTPTISQQPMSGTSGHQPKGREW